MHCLVDQKKDYRRYNKLSFLWMLKMLKISLIFALLITFFGCANVKQINRGRHALKIMQTDPHPEESAFLNEVNSFREGATSGGKAVGGGCGCN
jgi:hypothetical protein